MKKQFFWKDKTGRGETATMDLEDILSIEPDEEDEDFELPEWDETLQEWAQNAEVGDTWELSTESYTRIK